MSIESNPNPESPAWDEENITRDVEVPDAGLIIVSSDDRVFIDANAWVTDMHLAFHDNQETLSESGAPDEALMGMHYILDALHVDVDSFRDALGLSPLTPPPDNTEAPNLDADALAEVSSLEELFALLAPVGDLTGTGEEHEDESDA